VARSALSGFLPEAPPREQKVPEKNGDENAASAPHMRSKPDMARTALTRSAALWATRKMNCGVWCARWPPCPARRWASCLGRRLQACLGSEAGGEYGSPRAISSPSRLSARKPIPPGARAPDGRSRWPMLHDVQAAGLTPRELAEQIVPDHHVQVPWVEETVARRPWARWPIGQYRRPACLEALAPAGGFTDYGPPRQHFVLGGSKTLVRIRSRSKLSRRAGTGSLVRLRRRSGRRVMLPARLRLAEPSAVGRDETQARGRT